MPIAIEVTEGEYKLGVPPPLKPIDPKTRSMMYRAKGVPPVAVGSHDIYIDFDDGSRVIDAFGGAAVAILGSSNETVMKAIETEQRKTGFIYGAFFSHTAGEELAEYLVKHSDGDFAGCNFVAGGSEAAESCLKTARQYWWDKGMKEKKRFIGRHMSYHGNTIGALSVAYHPGKRAPFASFVNEDIFHYVSPASYFHYGKPGQSEEEYIQELADELEAKIKELGPETVAAFMMEPIVASSQGLTWAPKGYFKKVREICDKYDVLLIFDEVMVGMWRMGRMFTYKRFGEGVKPDLLMAAKGLGAGYVPIGVMFANRRVVDTILDGTGFWNHGFTYTAFGTCCAGSLAVQKYLVENNFEEKIDRLEETFGSQFRERLLDNGGLGGFVIDIRGAGCFWAIEVQCPGQETFSPRLAHQLQAKALENGLVTLGMPALRMDGGGDCLMLAPPAICTPAQAQKIIDLVVLTITQMREDLVQKGLLEAL